MFACPFKLGFWCDYNRTSECLTGQIQFDGLHNSTGATSALVCVGRREVFLLVLVLILYQVLKSDEASNYQTQSSIYVGEAHMDNLFARQALGGQVYLSLHEIVK